MIRRGLLVSPAVVAAALAVGGLRSSLSALLGVTLALVNLWLAGRIIGGVAENRPELLMAAGLASLAVGLVLVVVSALTLRRFDGADFTVTGVVFALGHLVLVTWEAADAFLRIDPSTHTGLGGSAQQPGGFGRTAEAAERRS
jgi:hypothetical protein